jgi:hypothetical protein
MRKVGIIAAFCALALVIPASAIALNEYTLTDSAYSPSKAGKAKKPVPVGVRLGFDVADSENKRPLSLERLAIKQAGIGFNGAFFKKCTAKQITDAQSDENCPSGSLIATGYARNIAGNRSDRNDKSQTCYLFLRLHNGGRGKLSLFVRGSNTAPAGQTCPLNLAVAIPVSIAQSSASSTINLTIPESLKHPLATLTNSLVEMRLNVPCKTTRRNGKRRGFLEARGKCSGGRRAINYTFYNEENNVVRQGTRARCRK